MKEIEGFDKYSITKEGDVYSHTNNKFLKSCINGAGYPLVTLIDNNGKRKSVNVHRLVAKAFVVNPNPLEFNQVNHIDSNRGNCNYTNLEWCNQSLNCLHSFNVMKIKRHGSKLSNDDVETIRASSLSQRQIARMFNVSQRTINKIKTIKTYKEKYEVSRYAKSRNAQGATC
jgi:hypothetical protein